MLIGHSQGARILARLIVHEIEGKPEQRLLAGALILGFDVEVPEGKDVGGTFKAIPLCRSGGQNGCVVAYETFPASSLPPDDSRFTHPETPGMEIACTDPAALAGGRLDPILATQTNLLESPRPIRAGRRSSSRSTRPSCRCPESRRAIASRGRTPPIFRSRSTRRRRPGAWPATLPGDLVVDGRPLKSWGWHLIDVNVAMGNLIDFVSTLRKPGP